jgi:NAD(P)-dependent dehydrogenase (short-subunit alcohol dehydrogenase family)
VPRALRDSVAVVTGASSGIGRATARRLAELGAAVALAARSEESLREAAAECEAAGGRALVVVTDVADEDAVRELARRAAEHFGRIDVWLNAAAVMVYGSFEEVPSEVFRRVIETNLFGQIHGARAVLPYFRAQGSGVLVNVASIWGRIGSPQVSAYVTSKWGVLGFSECLRQALHDEKDIHVCSILPISVDTPIFHHAANYTGRAVRPPPPVLDPDRVVDAIVRSITRPRSRATVGLTGHLLTWLHTLSPALYDRIAPYAFHRLGYRPAPAQDGPGNVLAPMPEWNRVRAGWKDKLR